MNDDRIYAHVNVNWVQINRYSSLLNLNVTESRSTPNKLRFIPVVAGNPAAFRQSPDSPGLSWQQTPVELRKRPGGAPVNAGGVPAERRFTNEPGYTGTLSAFTRAPPGHHRRLPGRCCCSAGICMGPGGATVPSGLFPVPSRLFPVPRRSMPVLHGNYRFIPQLSPVVPGSSLSFPVHPGRAPVPPGKSRITHRGSTGIIDATWPSEVVAGIFTSPFLGGQHIHYAMTQEFEDLQRLRFDIHKSLRPGSQAHWAKWQNVCTL
ncbi:hypothetical protein DPMN_078751 [Dreissena polymorpha]|uniref:Uncharacterized protein n=1 Tax=Dreissena polymorpha TaxID=45954 RepID=A0A9D3YT45_DREPO|nr:hypothetical protein DPMN_078751 [Dreissena polymorpha]